MLCGLQGNYICKVTFSFPNLSFQQLNKAEKRTRMFARELQTSGSILKCLPVGVPGWLSRLSIWILISVQVMISWLSRSSPASRSTLSLLGVLSLLSLLLPCLCARALSQNKQINVKKCLLTEMGFFFFWKMHVIRQNSSTSYFGLVTILRPTWRKKNTKLWKLN